MSKICKIIKIYKNSSNNLINIPKEIFREANLKIEDSLIVEYDSKTKVITIKKIGE